MTETSPVYYLFKGTMSPINAFAQANSFWAFHRNLGNVLAKRPHKRFAYAAVSASLQEAENGSVIDRWLPRRHQQPEASPTTFSYLKRAGRGTSLPHCAQTFSP